MAGPLHDLMQLQNKADLHVACGDCRHGVAIDIARVLRLFHRRQWRTGWAEAHRRFRCSRCGSKHITLSPDFYAHELRRQADRRDSRLTIVPPALRPGLHPPPPGVSIADWNRATERERKRLVDRARG